MDLIQTIIISIVEGLTEFLPVSSTGHMIITQKLLGVQSGDPFVHAFTFIIQFGAILSVVCLYWKHFFQMRNKHEFNEKMNQIKLKFIKEIENKYEISKRNIINKRRNKNKLNVNNNIIKY